MIVKPYTVSEIREKVASNDYSAELMLQHLLIRVAELEAAIRILDATETAYRHAGLGDPSKAYADLIGLVL